MFNVSVNKYHCLNLSCFHINSLDKCEIKWPINGMGLFEKRTVHGKSHCPTASQNHSNKTKKTKFISSFNNLLF